VSFWYRVWALLTWRSALLSDLQRAVSRVELAQVEIITRLKGIGSLMADNSQLLNDVADGLAQLNQPVADLLAENARLRGEDEGESAAAARVRAAYDGIAEKFRAEPEVPDVAPLPPVDDTPADQPA
jgi:peptidoglycan hydrolase CwlO-like protein